MGNRKDYNKTMTNYEQVTIGTDRQLFIDDFSIEVENGISRVLHKPTRAGVALAPEKPYELGHIGYMTTMKDGSHFRAWYRGNAEVPGKSMDGPFTAYAESENGIDWTKPDLGIYKYDESGDNNLVWTGPGYNMGPFRDDNPDAQENER